MTEFNLTAIQGGKSNTNYIIIMPYGVKRIE